MRTRIPSIKERACTWLRTTLLSGFLLMGGCSDPVESSVSMRSEQAQEVKTEIENRVWAFHAADTSKDAEAVINLLWPEYTMFVDGNRVRYDDIVTGSRAFMASLALFHTEWTDLQIIPLGPDAAVASFAFRDSILTKDGTLTQSRGPNTFVWQKRKGEWRLIYGDADHYPL